jgi:hypothetical protein
MEMVVKSSFEAVRKLGLRLPQVEEGTMYGKPALKIHGRPFVCMSSHKSAEPDSLMVRADFEQRAELLNADPSLYYITDHYKDYPAVLVRLPRVTPDVLRDLLGMAYRLVAGEANPRAKKTGAASVARFASPADLGPSRRSRKHRPD